MKVKYLTNETLRTELAASRKLGRPTTGLANAFSLLANRISHGPKYCRYSYREDLVSAAILKLLSIYSKLDETKPDSNPFSYFSTVVIHVFWEVCAQEKKQSDIQNRLLNLAGYAGSFTHETDIRHAEEAH